MEIEELEEKLEKISLGCEKCKAKMCSICPNGQIKKTIRNKLKILNPSLKKEKNLIKKIKDFLTKIKTRK
ncbi:MAG: hypothetical protein ACRC8M_11015 [Cetobacterium sp.]|uniref:hypothetical protein n=1 Tax=Cetobacterium sp. TaxID=2071632 RepID=UPI003F303D07